MTPFICSSSIETVQSLIVAESPSPLDHLREGLARVVHFKTDRKLPIYRLIGPSVLYHLSYYLLYSITRETIIYLYFTERKQRKPRPVVIAPHEGKFFQDPSVSSYETINSRKHSELMTQLTCSLYAHLITDVLLYPFQTVLYR